MWPKDAPYDPVRSRLSLVPFSKPSVTGARACRIATSADRLAPAPPRRLRLLSADRLPWMWLSKCGCRSSKPWYSSNRWLWSSGIARVFGFTGDGDHAPGRPKTSDEVRDLIRQMSLDNPLWGAPRVHNELLKLGIEVSQATVGRYLPRPPKAPSPTWRSFLRNHMTVIVAIHTFLVATATFRMLYAVIVLDHYRRRVVHFEVTRNLTQVWLAWQITDAFPWDTAPRYLLRDRGTSYGLCFQNRVRAMGIEEVLTASVPHGKVHTSKELLAQSVARSSMRRTYVASCLVIFATITRAERICR
jgi:putative transposase